LPALTQNVISYHQKEITASASYKKGGTKLQKSLGGGCSILNWLREERDILVDGWVVGELHGWLNCEGMGW